MTSRVSASARMVIGHDDDRVLSFQGALKCGRPEGADLPHVQMAKTYSRPREPCINLVIEAALSFGGRATGTDVSEMERQEEADILQRR